MTHEEADKRIGELATPEFMDKLCEIVKLLGWGGRYIEIDGFVRSIHALMATDYELPNTDPYEKEE